MAATTSPVTPEQSVKIPPTAGVPFDFSQPPVIEGFTPLPRKRDESFREKLIRKSKENPFVPLGCLVAVGSLVGGLRAFYQGRTRQSQLFMRGRVLAQGVVLFAVILGAVNKGVKSN